ncbi:hypothetical protein E2C01_085129 [Portunus trituberculatus]|uniref:Uncharacterized protein n=1 Tax=Portunus trituberculatus TaxID=210409 RepID=A0A5B7J808_PORTR|nr:hypothetical protein [Portunus trituberculatus]
MGEAGRNKWGREICSIVRHGRVGARRGIWEVSKLVAKGRPVGRAACLSLRDGTGRLPRLACVTMEWDEAQSS